MAKSKRRRRQRSQPHALLLVPPVPVDGPVTPGLDDGPIALAELRRALGLTQVALAARMEVSQRAISHLEHEPNPRAATVDGYVRGLGGRLQLRAVFSDRVVDLNLPLTPQSASGTGPRSSSA
jgi:DNA-binding XRE family transcriptional regulator